VAIGERIKKLRKDLSLTQQEFADKLKLSRSNIATYEVGKNNPADAVINLICREFNVSETWLRTGKGEMFVELPRNEALSAQIQAFLQGGMDSFRERLVSLPLRLSPEQWDILEGYLVELMKPPSTTQGRTEPDIGGQARTQTDIAAELAELKRQNQEKDKQLQALAAKVAAMEEEDALLTGAFSASPSASAGSIRLAEKVKK